jgi:hypothetical protein
VGRRGGAGGQLRQCADEDSMRALFRSALQMFASRVPGKKRGVRSHSQCLNTVLGHLANSAAEGSYS